MEICNVCGCSVKPGSGNFVNRVPDCNTEKDRKEMGRAYPEGDFVCVGCDSNGVQEEYKELLYAMNHDDVDVSLSTAFDRGKRVQEIEDEYGIEVTDQWAKEMEEKEAN